MPYCLRRNGAIDMVVVSMELLESHDSRNILRFSPASIYARIVPIQFYVNTGTISPQSYCKEGETWWVRWAPRANVVGCNGDDMIDVVGTRTL